MANVQAAVRAFASEYLLPSQVCAQINSVLFTNTAPEKFVTLFYGVLDAHAGTLQYANAGHLRPLLVRSSGANEHLQNGGALLGVFPTCKYEDSIVEFKSGDLLLLFTDGITEAMGPGGEEFGEERMLAAVRSADKRPVRELQTQLLSSVREFCNSRLSDDATLIMVAASPQAAELKGASINRNHTDEPATQYAGVRS
jgi:sigma-B regulation protein RsbU (phosphoserine phosphatase)